MIIESIALAATSSALAAAGSGGNGGSRRGPHRFRSLFLMGKYLQIVDEGYISELASVLSALFCRWHGKHRKSFRDPSIKWEPPANVDAGMAGSAGGISLWEAFWLNKEQNPAGPGIPIGTTVTLSEKLGMGITIHIDIDPYPFGPKQHFKPYHSEIEDIGLSDPISALDLRVVRAHLKALLEALRLERQRRKLVQKLGERNLHIGRLGYQKTWLRHRTQQRGQADRDSMWDDIDWSSPWEMSSDQVRWMNAEMDKLDLPRAP
jgi:hypothetical protein